MGGCQHFELLAVNLIVGAASKVVTMKKKTEGPIVEKVHFGTKRNTGVLSIYDLHCVGACTGLRLKSKKDVQKLTELLVQGRTFSLQDDPLPDVGQTSAKR